MSVFFCGLTNCSRSQGHVSVVECEDVPNTLLINIVVKNESAEI